MLTPWKPWLNQLPIPMKKDIESLYLEFRRHQPDLVHAWQDGTNINVAIAALMAGIPGIILFARSQRPDSKTLLHMRHRPYLKNAYKSILKNSNIVLCINSESGAIGYSEWLDIPVERIPIIHNGIDFNGLSEVSINSDAPEKLLKLSIPKGALVIGCVFRFVPEKQPSLWFETVKLVLEQNDNIHAIMVGDGGLLPKIKSMANSSSVSSRFHIVGGTRAVKVWLDRFDLFLLTSKVEGLPNVLIEAQAFGVPTISTNAGGAIDTFIDGKSGHLIDSFDPLELSEKIISCIGDKNWLETASKLGKDNARIKFSNRNMLKTLLHIYKSSLEDSLLDD